MKSFMNNRKRWLLLGISAIVVITVMATVLFSAPGEETERGEHVDTLSEESGPYLPPGAYDGYLRDSVQKREFEESFREYKDWIVKWRDGFSRPEESGFNILHADFKRNLLFIELHEETSVGDWYEEWSNRSDIEFLEPSRELEKNSHDLAETENMLTNPAPFLDQINAAQGWQITDKNDTATIAVLDTGVDLEHPALEDHLVDGYSVFENYPYFDEPTVEDYIGHGTKVTGVLASTWDDPNKRGLLSSANIMPIKVVGHGANGEEVLNSQTILLGINQAIDAGADIIVLSAGDSVYSQSLEEAVVEAEEEGILIVAATGNDQVNGENVLYPAAYPTVLAVGAVDAQNQHAAYSNYGPEVSVVAPGAVMTTEPGGGYSVGIGTSFAAPQVAGLAALILDQFPEMSPAQVRNHIMYTAQDVDAVGWDVRTGHGRIDVGSALTTELTANIFNPNNGPDQAAPLPVDTAIKSELRDVEDSNWYYVDAPYRGTLHINIDLDIGKYTGVKVTYYPEGDENRAQTYTVQKSTKLDLDIVDQSLIKLEYHDDEKRPTPLSYTITNSFTIYDDDQHPNETREEATEITPTQVYTGTLNKEEAENWFYFDVPERGSIKVTLEVDRVRLDQVVDIIRPDGSRQDYDLGELLDVPRFDFTEEVQEGRYYFVISDYWGNKVNAEYYFQLNYQP